MFTALFLTHFTSSHISNFIVAIPLYNLPAKKFCCLLSVRIIKAKRKLFRTLTFSSFYFMVFRSPSSVGATYFELLSCNGGEGDCQGNTIRTKETWRCCNCIFFLQLSFFFVWQPQLYGLFVFWFCEKWMNRLVAQSSGNHHLLITKYSALSSL